MNFYINIRNGLGNQMFQYALGCWLKTKYPDANIKYDLSNLAYDVNKRPTFIAGEIFENNFQYADLYEIRRYCNSRLFFAREKASSYDDSIIKRSIRRLKREINKKFRYDSITINEPNEFWLDLDEFADYIINYQFDKNGVYYLDGYWENIKFLYGIKEKLMSYFKFSNKLEESMDFSNYPNSVMVHIRRGDYLKVSSGKLPYENYMVCPIEYYKEAMKRMEMKITNPQYVFFSDDPDYVRREFSYLENYIVIEGHRDYEDLQSMTTFHNFILSNSTFGFWGAFLSSNSDNVIAPEIHYIHKDKEGDTVKHYFRLSEWEYIDNSKYI